MEVHDPLVLAGDVLVIPVTSLNKEVRLQIECEDDDFAVSRPRSRTPSTIVDAQAAGLLERFREPRTLVEAVILFSRERGLDPENVLDAAYPLVSRFLSNGFLVSTKDTSKDVVRADLALGTEVAGYQVVRPLQVFEDTHVYLVRNPAGTIAALKIQRPGAATVGSLQHEGQVLRHLDGVVAPSILDAGETEGRRYLVLEWCPGVDANAAAAEWRGAQPMAMRRLARLCHVIVKAYAELHARGVLHGDVHPRNVIVGRGDSVRLVDFGLAMLLDQDPAPGVSLRGGVAFFFEPEYAAAQLGRSRQPQASHAGEQYALAALLYNLITGAHYLDFSLERKEMLRQLLEEQPLSFSERSCTPWPQMEAVLGRALAKEPGDRFPSLGALAGALAAICAELDERPDAKPVGAFPAALQAVLDRHLEALDLEGSLFSSGIPTPPTSSVVFGAAGIATALYRIASQRDDAMLLSLADAWACRATTQLDTPESFYNAELEITPERVGEASAYHSPSGVFAVQALIAKRMGDQASQAAALDSFLIATTGRQESLDLNLGHCSVLLAGAMLIETLPQSGFLERTPLLNWGNRTLAHVWENLDAMPSIVEAEIDHLGIAHGWAGFLYATLHWCAASGTSIPSTLGSRLEQLGALAEPAGRGLRWPWRVTRHAGEAIYMPGWCNGSAGYVFLWTLAHRLIGSRRYLELAEGAAWDSWDAPESFGTLCCGLVGRSYALLNMYRHSGDKDWLRRATELGVRAAKQGHFQQEFSHSLYKGELGLAVLAADLQRPDEAVQPFFEPEGWPVLEF